MKSLLEYFGIALCGLATAVMVAIANVVVTRVTGFNFFTLSVFLVLPIGALITGFAASSGYYFGALYFHKKPGAVLLIQVIAIAGLAQFLIYWMDYATFVLDDGRKASEFMPFAQYLDILLTKSQYRVFGRVRYDAVESGSSGYWNAAIQFAGFLLGGLIFFGLLQAKPVCKTCDMYLRPLAKKTKEYPNVEVAGAYYDTLFRLPVGHYCPAISP